MKTHRLTVHDNNLYVGTFDGQGETGKALLEEVAQFLAKDPKWHLSRWVSDSEKRILESSPAGIKILRHCCK